MAPRRPARRARADLDTLNENNAIYTTHELPEMNVTCTHCGALRFKSETDKFCCGKGKTRIPPWPNLPPALHSLFTENAHFKRNIRRYNQYFSFVSNGLKLDRDLANMREGVYSYRVHGELYHLMGSLLPQDDNAPTFSQIYMYDPDFQVERRQQLMGPTVDPDILRTITDLLHQHNPFVRLYQQARHTRANEYRIAFRAEGVDMRRYNAPQVSEVGAILVDNEEGGHRDIVVRRHDASLFRISETHPSCEPLSYPLLKPFGTPGWTERLTSHTGSRQVTMRQAAVYHLMVRDVNLNQNPLHISGRLFQQWCVEKFCSWEQQNLRYLRHHQQEIRAERYSVVADAVNHPGLPPGQTLGRAIILPATFTGSPRAMRKRYHDSMAIVRKKGKADLFITITCNPTWPEISRNLLRPDAPCMVDGVCRKTFPKILWKKLTRTLRGFQSTGAVTMVLCAQSDASDSTIVGSFHIRHTFFSSMVVTPMSRFVLPSNS
mmetsp:Transcript_13935/g.25807  ORF Transcript_13935/g.25807 Transcript_13935/m.25807 type:complete len:491 (-) Transcript_13935:4232-5704(-)